MTVSSGCHVSWTLNCSAMRRLPASSRALPDTIGWLGIIMMWSSTVIAMSVLASPSLMAFRYRWLNASIPARSCARECGAGVLAHAASPSDKTDSASMGAFMIEPPRLPGLGLAVVAQETPGIRDRHLVDRLDHVLHGEGGLEHSRKLPVQILLVLGQRRARVEHDHRDAVLARRGCHDLHLAVQRRLGHPIEDGARPRLLLPGQRAVAGADRDQLLLVA